MEAGWRFFDEVWVVIVDPATAIARVTASRGMSADEVRRRIDAQLSNAQRARLADRVIENDGTLDELRAKVRDAWHALTS
jgi:dephospho-CoA kinase